VPTYEYRCDHCAKNFDVVQSFHDEPLTACPTCGEPVKKVFGSVGIVFKGSGFYKTDSRSGGSSSRPAESTPAAASGDGGGSTSESSTSESSTPAPSTADSSSSSTGAKDKVAPGGKAKKAASSTT
jgi:putative FmdB family regulatory protein